MDPELKKLLEDNLELARENNRLLRSMRRAGWLSALWRLLWWAFLIISSYYLYQEVLAPWFGDVGSFHMPTQAELQRAVEQYQAQHQ